MKPIIIIVAVANVSDIVHNIKLTTMPMLLVVVGMYIAITLLLVLFVVSLFAHEIERT